MYIYAGIDEAGYGPLLGPLLVGRTVIALPELNADAKPPDLWHLLAKSVSRTLTGRKGRIAVNDSKKLNTPSAGLSHLERGALAFTSLVGREPISLDHWLAFLGEQRHTTLDLPQWYLPCDTHPWAPLPAALEAGELAVARGMLKTACRQAHIEVVDIKAAVVFEDQFNRMVEATRSKAATSFTFVATHLRDIFDQFGQHHAHVAVDRQSGRSHYRQLLAQSFPEADLTVYDETDRISAYHLSHPSTGKSMTVSFMVQAEEKHLPVALASMVSKYTRELLMARFNAYFTHHWPHLKPTAGYATDGRRFMNEVEPLLPQLGIQPHQLCRLA